MAINVRVIVGSEVTLGDDDIQVLAANDWTSVPDSVEKHVAAAEAAGVLEVEGDIDRSSIEPDEVSLEVLAEAQADGRWQEGNLQAYEDGQSGFGEEI
jgi:hypothetical protein